MAFVMTFVISGLYGISSDDDLIRNVGISIAFLGLVISGIMMGMIMARDDPTFLKSLTQPIQEKN